ncbi:MAG: glutaredoxin family protein [Elusimicrobiales bacterium]
MKTENLGKDKLFLFALSTCIWCKKLKMLLDQLGADYDFVYVDQLDGEEKQKAVEALLKHNPAKSFPTLVAGGKCIIGYQEERVKELVSKCPRNK